MAEFSGKIVSVVYANPEHDLIKIRYEDSGLINVFVLDVDHPDYPALEAEGWDEERILDETAELKRAESQAYNMQINAAAREMLGLKELQDERNRLAAEKEKLGKEVHTKEEVLIGLDKEVKVKTNEVDSAYFEHLWEINENKEELFKCKLWALELEKVKAADKTIKTAIRKSPRITSVLKIIDELE